MPHLYIIAGPNGAGKTTAAMTLLPKYLHVREFVNADEIARGLSPFNVEGVAMEAGRLMLKRMRELVDRREDFAFETTLASKSFAPFIRRAKAAGYKAHLLFMWLERPEVAVRRVAMRVANGGHSIPEEVIHRRYFRGISNLMSVYISIVDSWSVHDNMHMPPPLIAEMTNGRISVYNEAVWTEIQSL